MLLQEIQTLVINHFTTIDSTISFDEDLLYGPGPGFIDEDSEKNYASCSEDGPSNSNPVQEYSVPFQDYDIDCFDYSQDNMSDSLLNDPAGNSTEVEAITQMEIVNDAEQPVPFLHQLVNIPAIPIADIHFPQKKTQKCAACGDYRYLNGKLHGGHKKSFCPVTLKDRPTSEDQRNRKSELQRASRNEKKILEQMFRDT